MFPECFHSTVAEWFAASFPAPTDCQRQAWAAVKQGQHTLIAAPTGSGKTLAAFLAVIDDLVWDGIRHGLPDRTLAVYVSPLKALSNDINKNLDAPLDGIARRLFEAGHGDVAIRAMVRTGDTPAAVRTAMLRHPPHILVTTPESLYILLTSAGGRRMLEHTRTVIVDEIHAVVDSKRGSHLALSLERLDRLVGGKLLRIGLSATQNPIETVARFLVGGSRLTQQCRIVDTGHRRRLDLALELPPVPLQALLSHETAALVYDRMAELIQAHRTTLIFVNTRRLAERLARQLSERIGAEHVTSHHGSLAKEHRLDAEQRLKQGQLKALVATASLELGIDIGDVDLVCQFGAVGSIAALLQRVGRAGHHAGGVPKGRLFPTSRDDLIEALALLYAIERGTLDRLQLPEKPLDVLAQHLVAMAAGEDWREKDLFDCVRGAYPYRNLTLDEFTEIVAMLAEGYHTRHGLRGTYLYRDVIHGRVKARRGARLTAVTCGGAIPDTANYRVVLQPEDLAVGSVDEDFAIESLAGDIFQLGNTSWRVLGLRGDALHVEDAKGQPPTIPFWFGEAPGRTAELSRAVADVRAAIGARCPDPGRPQDALLWLRDELKVSGPAAEQAVAYLSAAQAALGAMPTCETVVFERFFDEAGGMQLIVHAPFGSRVNRAWGLALRKRFCRSFNFELQAAATEDAIVLSLGAGQSFPLDDIARFLSPRNLRDVLIQALLAAPLFTVRWRWNATCALALKRFQGGRKTPPHLLRMQAEDLVTLIFPDQLACPENLAGDREIPDHPLVRQTLDDCLHDAMDLDGLTEVLEGIEAGSIRVVTRELAEPSPLAAEILTAPPYSFLDDAPAEERRTRAVSARRTLDPAAAADLGRLDAAAIQRVLSEVAPLVRDPDELHDALLTGGFIDAETEALPTWRTWFDALCTDGRAATLTLPSGQALWVATERSPLFRAVWPECPLQPPVRPPAELTLTLPDADVALSEILRGRLGWVGPSTTQGLARQLVLGVPQCQAALLRLEQDGYLLRGRFMHFQLEDGDTEWCERRLLARIHRYTLDRLRRAIEPVSSQQYQRFLWRWLHAAPDTRLTGGQAVATLLEQFEGYTAAAGVWESDILPLRLTEYDPDWLDQLCLAGRYTWTRVGASPNARSASPLKSTPIAFLPRRHIGAWLAGVPEAADTRRSANAQRIYQTLQQLGASFFEELVARSGLLRSQAEAGLAELVAHGTAHCDGFRGMRALLMPEAKKRRLRGLHPYNLEDAGRWSLLGTDPRQPDTDPAALEHQARVLLRRYGVVCKTILTRENHAARWFELLPVLRRLEARGEIRGGRFVAGPFGEQFALPEAVDALRKASASDSDSHDFVCIAAADPLNLVGILDDAPRIPASSGNRVLYRNGTAVAALVGKEVVKLGSCELDDWDLKQRLIRRQLAPAVRAYL